MRVRIWDESHHLRYDGRIPDMADAWHFAANMLHYGYRIKVN